MRRLSKCLCIALTALILLSACGSGDQGSSTTDTSPAVDTNTGSGAVAEDKITGDIIVFQWAGDAMFQDLVPAFNKKYPGVNVILEHGSNSVAEYLQVQRVRFLSGENIDVTAVRPESRVDYIEAGYLMDLTGQPFLNNFEPSIIEALSHNGKCYGYPMFLATVGVLYNKEMFDANGWTPATNIDEFIELCQKIKDAGIIPHMNAGRDGWPIQFDVYPFLHDVMVKDPAIFDKIKTGDAKYTDRVFVDAFTRIADYYSRGFIGAESLGLDYSQAVTAFATGQTAMFIQGNWIEGDFIDPDTGKSVVTFDYGVFQIPHNKPGEPQVSSISFGITWGVSSATKSPEAALSFMDFMATEEGARLVEPHVGLFMPVKGFVSEKTESWTQILNNNAIDFFYDNQSPGANAEMLRVLQMMFLGDMGAEEALQAIQDAQERGQ